MICNFGKNAAIDKIREMDINNENLESAIRALSEYYDQNIVIKDGVKVVI